MGRRSYQQQWQVPDEGALEVLSMSVQRPVLQQLIDVKLMR
jgi:hypothetical protein